LARALPDLRRLLSIPGHPLQGLRATGEDPALPRVRAVALLHRGAEAEGHGRVTRQKSEEPEGNCLPVPSI
jgi:hypothetical protein